MKNLYYATFERGLVPLIKIFLKKQDKNSSVKKLYDDSVLFFGDEKFKGSALPFKTIYQVLDSNFKVGAGALNSELKHFLERRDLKVSFPKTISSFKLIYKCESENKQVDEGLKKAVEITLKKQTKRQISFTSELAELVFLSKKDGENLFMKKVFMPPELIKFSAERGLAPDLALALNFLSEPSANEVSLDPFSASGIVSYVRALCFKKANVIANEENEALVSEIKRKAKALREKHFSVLNYNFLSEEFPIHFIDKVVTNLPENLSDFEMQEFFDKLAVSKVKIVAICMERGTLLNKFISKTYDIEMSFDTSRYTFVKLKYRG
ncbi:MAG: hypothetical protein IJ538_03950 [Clostridia bacterium]|nr:hypothetical protein [Clostridia bacterium]